MKILLLDNYDSFTYNIDHLLRELGETPDVIRNDKISVDEVDKYDAIVISPGPGIPSEAGILLALLERYAGKKPIMGVCLGEQAIGERFGASLINLPEVYHGIQSEIEIDNSDYLFKGLPQKTKVGRYHSWAINPDNTGEEIEVIARSADGNIMAVRHKEYDIRGVQFHPESVLTPEGKKMFENWLEYIKSRN